MSGKIDEIISEKSFQQIEKLITLLGSSKTALSENIRLSIELNNTIGGAKSFKDYQNSVDKTEKSLKRLQKEQERTRLEEIRLQQAREKAFDKYEASLKKVETQQIKAAQSAARMASPYNQLVASLAKAEKEALDLGAALGATSPEYIQAGLNVQKLRQQVDALERPLGRFQRNVGNYASGFNGLGNSINQITREFPSFAFSVQTGFLALSNNIPIFFDEMKRARESIAQLRAQGERVPGLFSQLTKSLFSFGTVLSIGVTLLTIYGKEIGEFFSALFKGKDAMDDFTLRQKALAASVKEADFSEVYKDILVLNKSVELAKQGYISSDAVIKQYNESVGKTAGTVKTLGEVEQRLVDIAPELIKFTFLKAIADKAAGLAAEKAVQIQQEQLNGNEEYLSTFEKLLQKIPTLGKKRLDFEDGLNKAVKKRRQDNVNDLVKEQQAQIKVFEDYFKQAAELASKNNFDFFGGGDKGKDSALELRKQILIGLKQTNDAILEDESRLLTERIQAANKSIDLAKQIAQIERDIAIQGGENKKVAEQMFQNDFANIIREGNKTIADIKEQDRKKELDDLQKLYEQQLKSAKEYDKNLLSQIELAAEQRKLQAQDDADIQLIELAREYSEGEIKTEEYAKRRLEIQRNLANAIILEEIKGIETIIALQKSAGQDTTDNETKIAELKRKLSKDTTAAQIADLEKLAEKEKELNEAKFNFLMELNELGRAIVIGNFERADQELEKEAEKIDIQKAREIEAVDRSIASEQVKADKIAVIEAKAQARREGIERRQRQLSLERAKFDRAFNIAGVIGNTARAVTAALPNIPLSILIAAIGAAQIGQILASPIPKFEKGGKMKQSGLAEYGHGTELRIDPTGEVSLTKPTPEVGYVQAGTQFISNKDLVKMIARPEKLGYAGGQQIDLSELVSETKKSNKYLKEFTRSGKNRGLNFYSSTKGKDYLNRNIN